MKCRIASLIIWAILVKQSNSRIGCYRCKSSNGSNPACEDPFNARHISYENYCQATKRHRSGVFPASYCVKVYGYDKETSGYVFIRECTTEDLGNFKGIFQLNGKDVSGVVATCRGNACNRANKVENVTATWFFIAAVCRLLRVRFSL